jgi:hypothetical protein
LFECIACLYSFSSSSSSLSFPSSYFTETFFNTCLVLGIYLLFSKCVLNQLINLFKNECVTKGMYTQKCDKMNIFSAIVWLTFHFFGPPLSFSIFLNSLVLWQYLQKCHFLLFFALISLQKFFALSLSKIIAIIILSPRRLCSPSVSPAEMLADCC